MGGISFATVVALLLVPVVYTIARCTTQADV
jgi:hypothetical protein